MPWPNSARATGYVVTAADWNEIAAAFALWGGNADAGGYNLTNVPLVVCGSGDGTGTTGAGVVRGAARTGTNVAGSTLTIAGGNGTGTGGGGSVIIQTAPAGSTGSTANTLTERMRIDANGNVGIGTTTAAGNTLRYLDIQNTDTGASAGAIMRLITSDVAGTGSSVGQIVKYKNGTMLIQNSETNAAGIIQFSVGASERMRIDSGGLAVSGAISTSAGAVSDSKGNVREIAQNSQTSAYVLVAADSGKHISITTGGVTVNSGIFSAGQAITIFNNSGSNQTITQGASVTLYQAGTANTGNRTLAQRGVATILCVASNVFVICGAGVS